MIHDITLSDPAERVSPPETMLRVSAVDDLAFVTIEKYGETHDTTSTKTLATIAVSLPALREALNLLRHDVDREEQRPQQPGAEPHIRSSRITGDRYGVMPL